MPCANEVNDSSKTDEKLVLRDLQSLLRQSMGESLEVIDYDYCNLLPKGENFLSTMLKIEANVKKSKNAPVEHLSLVAKMGLSGGFLKDHFNATASFAKEIYVFEKLLPSYRQLEKEAGMKDEELIDILPKFYGGRLTLDEENKNRADDDAVLLMENVKAQGYCNMNRKKGFDLSHSKLALLELARFHALGVALRKKHPETFEEAKRTVQFALFDMNDEVFDDLAKHTFDKICEDSRIAQYKDRIMKTLDENKDLITGQNPAEPWISIIHGDFWLNNIMFQQGENSPGKVKFVDFQLTNVNSPLRDIPYFFSASTSSDILDVHLDDLLDLYYERFVEILQKLNCDASAYTKSSFEEQLRKDCKVMFYHCISALKFITFDTNESTDLNDVRSSIMMGENSSLYLDRAWGVVKKFVEKNWI